MRKVIVSGGNGFIGSSLIRRLRSEGIEVHALVNDNHHRLDTILDAAYMHDLCGLPQAAIDIVTRVQPDTIFHLAAVYAEPTSPDCVLSMLDGNLTLGACLLFGATQCSVQPVFLNTGTYWQFDSEFTYAPNTLYAATKQAFQNLLQFYRDRMRIAAMTLILYETFGEADTRRKLWHQVLSAPAGDSLQLSGGEQTIHLVHIDDVVEAFLQAANLLHAGVPTLPLYTVHSDRPRKLRELLEDLNAGADLRLHLNWGAIPYWDGQIFEPAVGQPVPGWQGRIDVMQRLLHMASSNRSPGEDNWAPRRKAEVQSNA